MEKNLKLMTFESESFGTVRTVSRDGEPWFVAADVCKALELSNPSQAMSRLEEDEKMTLISNEGHSGQRGGAQRVNIISEAGLYTLVLSSRKPEAKAFRRWITHEVIPAIRKHGGYMTDSLLEQVMREPQLIYVFAERLFQERQQTRALEEELAAVRPKADYFDAFVNPGDCTNIRATAKELQVSERAFCKLLLEGKFLYRCPAGNLMPYSKPKNLGLFIVRDYCRHGHKGAYTLITPKGKDLFRQMMLEMVG